MDVFSLTSGAVSLEIEAQVAAIKALQHTTLQDLGESSRSKRTNDVAAAARRVLLRAAVLQGAIDGDKIDEERLDREDIAAISLEENLLEDKMQSRYKKPKRSWQTTLYDDTLQHRELEAGLLNLEMRLDKLLQDRSLREQRELSALVAKPHKPKDVCDLLRGSGKRPAPKWHSSSMKWLIPHLPVPSDPSNELEEVYLPTLSIPESGDSNKQHILDLLSDPNADLKQAELTKMRMPQTGGWLSHLEQWEELLSGDESVLWCYGKPGLGKSMLMSFAVEKLKKEIEHAPEDAVIYYYFDHRSRSSAQIVMSSLLRQLCEHDVPLPNLTTKWREWKRNQENPGPQEQTRVRMQLEDVVVSFFTVLSRFDRVFVCLDGLDACNDLQELTVVLQRLISSPCRLFITSRWTPKLDRVLEGVLRVRIEMYNQRDLRDYPTYFLRCNTDYSEIMGEFSPSHTSKLLHCPDGDHGFLGLILQLDELSKQINAYGVKRLLNEFEHASLVETYKIVLRRIGYQAPARARLASCILTWVAYAYRPLTFRELQQAVAIDPYRGEGHAYATQSATDPKLVSPAKLMEEVCMGLLTIDRDQNIVATTPPSLAPYLRQFRKTLFPDGEEYIATCIVSFLQHKRLAEHLETQIDYDKLLKDLPFSAYASQHWGTHVREYWREDIPRVVSDILGGRLDALAQFLHIFHPRFANGSDRLAYPLGFSVAHFAVYFNFHNAQNAVGRETSDTWDRNVLHIACQQCDADEVESLGFEDNVDEEEHELRPATTDAVDDGAEEIAAPISTFGSSKTRLGVLHFFLEHMKDSDVNQKDKDGKTPLHYAIISGNKPMVENLVQHGADMAVLDESSWTPLDYAARENDLNMARYLLDSRQYRKMSEPETDKPPGDSKALWIAASLGHRDIVRLLLRNKETSGQDRALFEAAKAGFFDIVRLLHRRKAMPSFQDDQAMTALHHTILTRNLEIADYLMRDSNVNVVDKKGRSPLHLAAEIGDLDVVRQLIRRGAKIEVLDKNGQTPLDVAVENGNSDVVKSLLNYLDPGTILSDPKRTNIMDSEANERLGDDDAEGDDGSAEATSAKEETTAKDELDKPDASELKEIPSTRLTALQLACSTGNKAVVAALLDAGANPDYTGTTSRTPLSYAAENGHEQIVKQLLATHRVDVNTADDQGWTPLSYAAAHIQTFYLLYKEDASQGHKPEKSGMSSLESELYNHMMTRIKREKGKDLQHCKDVLVATSLAYRPLSLSELAVLAGLSPTITQTIVEKCGSFLTIKDNTVYLIHQSAKDYLDANYESKLQHGGAVQGHADISRRSIDAMSKLRKNIYTLPHVGSKSKDITVPSPDPLEGLRYSCVYWARHVCQVCLQLDVQRNGTQLYDQVYQFLQAHLLHWLEALSLIGKTSEGILAIFSLEALIPAAKNPDLHAFIHDAKRFALYNRLVIEQAPLQIYCSALVFAPEKSIVRRRFEECIPPWIQMKPKVQANWNLALQTLEGHSGWVKSVAFSPDGKLIVSAGSDKTVRLWDTVTGTVLQTLKGHSDLVSSVAFSPDGKLVVSASWDKTVRLWDAITRAALQMLKGHSDWVTSVTFSPDGKLVVSASWDKTVRLWDGTTGAALQTLGGHSGPVSSVAFSPDGKLIVSSSLDKTIKLWDAVMGAALRTLKGHSDQVTLVAFSPDGKLIVSASWDKTVRLWDVVTGAVLQMFEGHLGLISSVAFSLDGKLIVSAGSDKTVRLWDAVTGAALQILEGHSDLVSSVAFSLNSKLVVSGSNDKTVRLWDAVTRAALQTPEGHSGSVSSITFSLDGKLIVSAGSDKTVKLWDAVTGATLQTLKGSSPVLSVAFSPDSKLVVLALRDKIVRLWDIVTGAALQALEGHLGSVSSVAFSPDSKLVVSGSDDKTIKLWDAMTRVALQTLESHSGPVSSVAFSPNGKLIVSSSWDETIRLWDTMTGAALQTLKGHSSRVTLVAFSPDGKLIVSASWDKTIGLWDATTGAALQTLKGHSSPVSSIAFSPDCKLVVSGSDDKTVRLWDALTGAVLQTLEGYSGPVSSVAFSLDGKLVVSDSHDETITLDTSLDSLEQLYSLFVSNNWVVERSENVLWLPPDYRATCVAIWNRTVVLGHSSGGISFLEFKQGSKLI